MPGPLNRGDCVFCGREFAASALSRHLMACPKRKEAQAAADATKRQSQTLYHLKVQDDMGIGYFLHLEMRGKATLKDLDAYLRAIWLECCGHLSAFEIEGTSYESMPDPQWSDAESMDIAVEHLFRPGLKMRYAYDFGSTTELVITVMAERQGKPLTGHPIYLMARNKFEPPPCMVCGKPATLLCTECMYLEDGQCELCDEHADEHEHDDMLLALVNSPRVGVCGYDGPAEPPY